MSAHKTLFDIFLAGDMYAIPDPGSAGTIGGNLGIDRSPAYCGLKSTGAEARTLPRPTVRGAIIRLFMETDGGDITLTVTGGYNENGDTTFTFSDPGQWVEFTSGFESVAAVYEWRLTSSYASANSTLALSTPATPAAVATSPGTAAPAELSGTGGLGGNSTLATTAVGGVGGGYSLVAGAGGVATAGATASTGGAGGAYVVTTGAGGAESVATVTSIGGAGGAITYTSGAGGAVSGAVSGVATGGASGSVTYVSGVGGAVTATTGTNVGGASGPATYGSGAGGAGGTTGTGGAGGLVSISGGAGGAVTGAGTGGAGANIDIAPGVGGTTSGGTAGRNGGTYINRGVLNAPFFGLTLTSIGTSQSSSPTSAQLLGGLITQTGVTGAGAITLPTGTALSAACPRIPVVGDSFVTTFANLGGGQTLTVTGATGTTVASGGAIATAKTATLLFINTGTNTWNIYVAGG